MQKLTKQNRWTWLAGIFSIIAAVFSANAGSAGDPYWYAVQVSANVSPSPAQITLSWPSDSSATGYTVSRKAFNSSSWSTITTLPGNASTWTDSNVSAGSAYEYSLSKTTSAGYSGTGYVYAGINAGLVDSRGKVLLVVDNTYATQLASELTRLQQDLAGDGWTVVRRDVNRTDSPVAVKNVIKSEYNNGGLRSVFLFGHVAVPYSGNFGPDNHDNHQGAWAADVYYADMDGNWSDSSVYNTSAEKPWNHNVPGDGKFDQSTLPSDADLEVGRVDLSNMTCFSNKTPSRSELDLLRQYLNKDHNFRHGLLNVSRRGTVSDNFGVPYGEAFAAAGWRNSAAFFGAANTSYTPGWQFFTKLESSHLFAYGCGGGSFTTCDGVGSSDNFATSDPKAVFMLFLGSYFGDWDNESAFLRAPLGSSTHTLATGWSGRPEWFLHHMALGETIGYGARLSQNNGGLYKPNYQGTRGVHIALQGDPTLRLHPVLPVSNLLGVSSGAVTTLNWTPSVDTAIAGYHVYRGTSANGPFTRVTSSLLTGPTYVDSATPAGAVYMVRAVKLENSGSGAYYNASQGVFYNSNGVNPTAPAAPSNLSVSTLGATQLRVTWSDNSANETGFQLERKTGAAGSYATVLITSANATTYTDTALTQGTQYSYRLTAVNSAGSSTSLEASGLTAAAATVNASATFVKNDTATKGSWKNVYGAEGSSVVGDASTYPGYVTVTPAGSAPWVWTDATAETRALQRASGIGRVAACLYSATSFTVDLNFNDAATHRVAFYFMDWDTGRVQTVEVLDATSGAVLSSQSVSSFSGGKYLVWDLKGNVRLRLTKTGTFNAVLSGIFFDSAGQSSGQPQQTTAILGNASMKTIRITGTAGQTYKLYSSSNLISWNDVTTVTLTAPTYDYTDNSAGTKFYKAVPQ